MAEQSGRMDVLRSRYTPDWQSEGLVAERNQMSVEGAGADGAADHRVGSLNIISLGAGVQSSTMALMAVAGEIMPMPDGAIFADTQAEPRAVYDWLAWLEIRLPFPVHRVTQGDLTATIGRRRPKGRYRSIPLPAFVKNLDGTMGGLLNRSCTQDFKLRPIRRELRKLLGLTGKRSPIDAVVTQWIGISVDEAHRMKGPREPWVAHRFPLIEKLMRRSDCLAWMKAHDYPEPPKSSCIYCPFHSRDQWLRLMQDEMAEAIRVDNALREHPPTEYRSRGTMYLHRSGVPLAEVDFRDDGTDDNLDLFGNECEGMCGV